LVRARIFHTSNEGNQGGQKKEWDEGATVMEIKISRNKI